MNYIIDLIILLFIVFLVFLGVHRGLVLTLCGLLAVIVAFVGASFIAPVVSPAVTEIVEPHISNILEAQVNELVDENNGSFPLDDTLKEFGFYEDLVVRIDDAVTERVDETRADIVDALAQIVTETLVYFGIFLLSFIIILLIWSMLSRALDLVARLPVLNFCNRAGGGILGGIKAIIFLFIAAWLVQYLGQLIPESTVQSTYLLKFFMQTNPFDLFGL